MPRLLTDDQTDAIHWWLIMRIRPPRSDIGRDLAERGRLSGAEPNEREFYLGFPGIAWGLLFVRGGLVVTAFAFVLDKFLGMGTEPGLVIFAFVGTFCLVGTVDAAWRLQLVGAAKRRQKQLGGVVDERGRTLMRLSRLNDASLLLQLLIGLIAAWYLR